MLRTLAILLALAGAPASSFAAAGPPGWKVLADCAAAYRANSEIHDPNRAPAMKASIADQANDYVTAAIHRLPQETKTSAARAGRTVHAYVAKRASEFSRQPRSAAEHFIEACPQAGA